MNRGHNDRRGSGNYRQGGGGHYKRGRDDDMRGGKGHDIVDDIEARLVNLIVRIGDKNVSALEAHLDGLANALIGDLPRHRQKIIDTIVDCVMHLPAKTPVYATLVGLLNVADAEFGDAVVARAHTELQNALLSEKKLILPVIIHLVRFFGELVSAYVIQPSGIFSLYSEFMGVLNKPEAPQVRKDYFVGLVLSTLPFTGPELSRRTPEQLERLLATLTTYCNGREPVTSYAPALVPVRQTTNLFEDEVDMMWAQVKHLSEEGWPASIMLQPYKAFAERVSKGEQHTVQLVDIPPHADTRFYLQQHRLRILDGNDMDLGEDPISRPVDRWLMEQYIIAIVHGFKDSHKDAAKQLFNLQDLFGLDVTSVLVDTLLNMLLSLPNSHHRDVYYGCLMVNMCKLLTSFAPRLEQALHKVFGLIPILEPQLTTRFGTWLAYHLSNFNFNLKPFAAWGEALEAEPDGMQANFVRDMLERLVRLAYWERVGKESPESLRPFLQDKPVGVFQFAQADGDTMEDAASPMARELVQRMRAKESPADVRAWLDSEVPEEVRVEVTMQTFIHAGAKSLSHLTNLFVKFHEILSHVICSPSTRARAIEAAVSFWQRSPQMTVIILDKLHSFRLVDNTALLTWLFSPDMAPQFTRSLPWEILHNTIHKTLAKAAKVEADLKVAEEAKEAGDTRDLGSEARLGRIRTELDTLKRERKELFLVVCQRLCMVLNDHLSKSAREGTDPETSWWHCTVGRFLEVGRQYRAEVRPYLNTLEAVLISGGDVDDRVKSIFQQFKTIPPVA